MTYTRRMSVPRRNEMVLHYEIARAVFYAQKALGNTAWCESVRRDGALSYDIYDLTFTATDRAYHPLQVEQAIRDWINAHDQP